ncbi:MAG TPA: adenylate/guanylate cyclase domain-containing protein [Terricaulis sp.]|nr:adenylate/guanylate cyclase domain-containing protein [Terricaulis sp.]
MSEETGPRRLAAIMSIDIAGFSALAEIDEAEAAALVTGLRTLLEGLAEQQGGRIFNTAGDGFMLEFCSAAGAMAAADALRGGQQGRRVRVGVHVGDVIATPRGDLLGHGVNVAARLQQLAPPGVVVVSVDVQRAVRGKLAKRLHPFGQVQLDKMSETIELFTLEAVPAARAPGKRGDYVLAILPFDNESDEAEMAYFSDGVADEIIRTLLSQSELKVIGRTSAFQFRGARKSQAAEALRASHVLDGAVRCGGQRLRVGVQLIDADTGVAIWSERYDGDRADVFALEEAIAAKVAAALRYSLTQTQRNAARIDSTAYELYLRARQVWLLLSDVDEEQAQTLLEHCVQIAPEFAQGWAALASVRAFLLPRDRDIIGEPLHNCAREAAEKALQLDPDCAQAFAALSLLKPGFSAHGEKLALINEALKRTPHDAAFQVGRAAYLYGVGRLREAGAAVERASRLDPLGPAVEGIRASLAAARGDTDTALDIIHAAWARWPDSPFVWYRTWVTLCLAGRLNEAIALAEPGAPPGRGVNERDVDVLRNYVALLRLPEAERLQACAALLGTIEAAPGPLALSTLMMIAGMGLADRAFDVLEHAMDTGRPIRPDNHDAFGMARAQSSLQLFVSNGGAPIWRYKRFPALAARFGLAQYWIETGHWPDCASEVDYDFKAGCAAAAGL